MPEHTIFPSLRDRDRDDVATSEGMDRARARGRINDGECPWCNEYSGDGVPQHASSAHPEEWDAYKDEEE